MCVSYMVKETTIDRVIFSLVRKNGQTYTELQKSAKSNQNSLTISLKYLVTEKIITKDENKKYFFSVEIRNKVLNKLTRIIVRSFTLLKKKETRRGEFYQKENKTKLTN